MRDSLCHGAQGSRGAIGARAQIKESGNTAHQQALMRDPGAKFKQRSRSVFSPKGSRGFSGPYSGNAKARDRTQFRCVMLFPGHDVQTAFGLLRMA